MPMFMCRWPNGDLSFLFARNKEDAIIMLDEWDNAELAELRQVQDFMLDFGLGEDGELEFQGFGERCDFVIWERAYPVLSKARQDAFEGGVENKAAGKKMIREAVYAEKRRLKGKIKGKLADTEIGKTVQKELGAPAALVNRYVKHAATEMLKKIPTQGRKN